MKIYPRRVYFRPKMRKKRGWKTKFLNAYMSRKWKIKVLKPFFLALILVWELLTWWSWAWKQMFLRVCERERKAEGWGGKKKMRLSDIIWWSWLLSMMEISKAWSNNIWSMVWVVFVGKYLGREREWGREWRERERRERVVVLTFRS